MSFIGHIAYSLNKWYRKLIHVYLQKRYSSDCGTIGEGAMFHGISSISGIKDMHLGNNVHIGDNAFIRAEGGVFIGDNVHISRNLVLYANHHNWRGSLIPFDDTSIYRPVVIEDNVWIGMNVTIIAGSHIGEGAIISAGSVVSGNIPPLAIYQNLSTRVYAREKKHYDELKANKQFGGLDGKATRIY